MCMQTEPAISVRADPDFTASHSSDAAALQQNAEEPSEDHPPEFKSAARQEHMDEAAAIRRQMQVCLHSHTPPPPPHTGLGPALWDYPLLPLTVCRQIFMHCCLLEGLLFLLTKCPVSQSLPQNTMPNCKFANTH